MPLGRTQHVSLAAQSLGPPHAGGQLAATHRRVPSTEQQPSPAGQAPAGPQGSAHAASPTHAAPPQSGQQISAVPQEPPSMHAAPGHDPTGAQVPVPAAAPQQVIASGQSVS